MLSVALCSDFHTNVFERLHQWYYLYISLGYTELIFVFPSLTNTLVGGNIQRCGRIINRKTKFYSVTKKLSQLSKIRSEHIGILVVVVVLKLIVLQNISKWQIAVYADNVYFVKTQIIRDQGTVIGKSFKANTIIAKTLRGTQKNGLAWSEITNACELWTYLLDLKKKLFSVLIPEGLISIYTLIWNTNVFGHQHVPKSE